MLQYMYMIHARPGDVDGLELDGQRLQDHEDPLLVRHDLQEGEWK